MKTSILIKQKLRKQHYLLIDLTIAMCLKVCLSKNSLLYKTSKNKDLLIQKSDKSNSGGVQRQDCLKKMNDILKEHKKFGKVSLKDDTLLNFAINQEKHVDKVLKNLLSLKV